MLEETALEEEATQTGSNLYRKATLLIAEILHTANRVLPLSMAAKIQVSPETTLYYSKSPLTIYLRPSREYSLWLRTMIKEIVAW